MVITSNFFQLCEKTFNSQKIKLKFDFNNIGLHV
jgi:hypothetical protein